MPSSKGKVNISNRFKSLSDILNVIHLGLNLFYLFQNEDCKNVKKKLKCTHLSMLAGTFILAGVGGGTKLKSTVSISDQRVIKYLMKIVILLNVPISTVK